MSKLKHLTVDQVLEEIESNTASASVSKISFPSAWQKVRPFLFMLSNLLGKKVKPYIDAVIAGIDSYVDSLDDET